MKGIYGVDDSFYPPEADEMVCRAVFGPGTMSRVEIILSAFGG
jgi:hypothetical protein